MTEQRRDIGRFIREQRKLAELSVRRLADMAGVSNPYLSQIERGLRKPSAEILQQLARALEVSAETMYVQAGMLDADHRTEPPSLEAAIRAAPDLTDDQRKALLSVYRSFLATNQAGNHAATATDDPATDDPATDRVTDPATDRVTDPATDCAATGRGADDGADGAAVQPAAVAPDEGAGL